MRFRHVFFATLSAHLVVAAFGLLALRLIANAEIDSVNREPEKLTEQDLAPLLADYEAAPPSASAPTEPTPAPGSPVVGDPAFESAVAVERPSDEAESERNPEPRPDHAPVSGEVSDPAAREASAGAAEAPAALRNADFADARVQRVLRPLLEQGTVTQALAVREGEAIRPVRATLIIHAPVRMVWLVLTRAEDWHKFLPKVTDSQVLSRGEGAMQVRTVITLVSIQRAEVVEDWTLVDNRRMESHIHPGLYAGWSRFELYEVADAPDQCLLVHTSAMEARNLLAKTIIGRDQELETAINQSVIVLRAEAFRKRAEALYLVWQQQRSGGDSASSPGGD